VQINEKSIFLTDFVRYIRVHIADVSLITPEFRYMSRSVSYWQCYYSPREQQL